MTFAQAIETAKEYGAKLPKRMTADMEVAQCWIDRIHNMALIAPCPERGDQIIGYIAEADRYCF